MPYSQEFEDDVVALDQLFEGLARRFLHIDTLRLRGGDGQNVHEVNVVDVREALQEAYLRGYPPEPESPRLQAWG